ncbi:concanavalin A-like lectin/glucanase domain-containing protein, partial [Vararia minispora EC-137]
RAHRVALKRSQGLASDLRVAFNGLLSDPPVKKKRSKNLGRRSSSGKTTCIAKTSNTNGTSTATGANNQPSASASASGTSKTAAGTGTSKTATATSAATTSTATSNFKVAQSYTGSDFWNKWDFFTSSDPTGGTVTYVDSSTAQSEGLVSVTSNGSAILKVDTTGVVTGGRKSVRITTQYTFNGGLVILDATHMPTGCGTWPAFWTNGPNWPTTGEIDIVEGVNEYTENQATIHTSSGCTISSSGLSSLLTGSLIGQTNCDATATNNQGCGIRDSRTNSFGAGFNNIGGGVYSMLWDSNGVSVWFFPRSSIPSDITAGAPIPSSWGTPMAFWSANSCNPSTFFSDHSAIFDTTFCGDWAGQVWNVQNVAGQSQSCAAITGAATCSDYVLNNGAAFSEAYWEVNSVKIYQ